LEEVKLEKAKEKKEEEIKEKAVYQPKEVAKLLKIGTTKTYELIREDKIKSKKIGSAYRILGKSILEFMEEDK
jgi:excisionase family DNA binding protein